MTLARTALRIAAIETIIGKTQAGGRVFDSRWSDLDPETYAAEAKPCIIVMTDAEDADQLSEQDGGPPFRREIELVLEFSIIQTIDVSGEEDPETGQPYPDGSYIVDRPASDRQTELSLDLMEHQATYALAESESPTAAVFRSFARIRKKEGHRQITDATGVKIAVRVVTFKVDTKDDENPFFLPGATPTGFDILPQPLRDVANSLPVNSPRRQLCEVIAYGLQLGDLGAVFEGMDVVADASPLDNGSSDKVVFKIETTEQN